MHGYASQADLDILALLTSDQSTLGPLKPPSSSAKQPHQHLHPHSHQKKPLPRRDQPLDALLISAVLAGSGPLSRHHFGHGAIRPGAYASCDESRPPSPSRPPIPSKVVMKSLQAPRSERLRLQGEREQRLGEPSNAMSGAVPIPAPTKSTRSGESSPRTARSHGTSMPSSIGASIKERPKRRMSIDPAPVSQMLQAASPSVNYFQSAFPQPTAVFPQSPLSGRPQVRCMARTRIPTPHGELFLHLYHNSHDNKEHLAVVIDPIQLSSDARDTAPRTRREIRSRTLDERWRDGETEMERVVRGAYVGRLVPGGEGQASTPHPAKGSIAEEDVLDDMDEQDEADILPLVRIHSECFTGETIGSMRCDCGEQLDEALRLIAQKQAIPSERLLETFLPTPNSSRSPSPSSTVNSSSAHLVPGRGVVIYMRQEGRGIGLLEKIRAYNLQDLGHDTVTANLMLGHGADERKYSVAAEILRDLGLSGDGQGRGHEKGIRLLTNNPEKVEGLAAEGIKVLERVGMVPRDWKCRDGERQDEKEYEDWRTRRAGVGLVGAGAASGPELEKYLRTKVERMGHLIEIPKH